LQRCKGKYTSFKSRLEDTKKRFSKWVKPGELENLELIKEYYGYSNEKAKSVLSLFDDEQIDELKKRIYKGGKRK